VAKLRSSLFQVLPIHPFIPLLPAASTVSPVLPLQPLTPGLPLQPLHPFLPRARCTGLLFSRCTGPSAPPLPPFFRCAADPFATVAHRSRTGPRRKWRAHLQQMTFASSRICH